MSRVLSPSSDITQLKERLIVDIQADRRAWRITVIPQIATLLLLSIVLSGLSAFGVYNSVVSLSSSADIVSVKKGIEVFVTGSSSLLGFVVLKLFTKLRESTDSYIVEEKRFTSDKNLIDFAASTDEITKILKSYYKIGKT